MKLIQFFTKAIMLTFTFLFVISVKYETQAQTKQLWGMTYKGGSNGFGTIFKTDSSGNNETVEQNFSGAINGSFPYGSIVQASDGKLYGMTYKGGINGMGVLFQYDPITSIYTKKLDFSGINGGFPLGSLMEASDGKLYGMTSQGGANNMGVLFQYDLANSIYIKKLDFTGTTNGSVPYSSLMQASDGKLYGMTYQGGVNNMGVLFQYDPVINSYTKKFDFAGATNGANPTCSLLQSSNGKLYGMTFQGGTSNIGVLFQYDPVTSTYTKKLDFIGGTNGNSPQGSLIQANDGKLYGMNSAGGASNGGVLFQFDPTTSIFTKKFDFSVPLNGQFPCGSLMQASDGKLYGMTFQGGVNSMGVLFQYDLVTASCIKKNDFTGINGGSPASNLIEITVNTVGINTLEKELALKLYPNPAHDLLTIELLTGNQKSATVIFENMFGQIIYETQMNTAIHQINTEHYARGIYLVKVKSNNEIITKKIILE